MNFKKLFAMAAALCMATATFTACGSEEKDDSSKKDTASSAAAKEESSAAEEESSAAEESSSAAEEESSTAEGGDQSDEPFIDELTGKECVVPDPNYTPVTEFEGYDAFLMFADKGESGSDWMWSNFAGQGYAADERGDYGAFGVDADITGDGTYTVALTADSIAATDPITNMTNAQVIIDEDYGVVYPAMGANVFCVDITGICDGTTSDDGEELKTNALKDGDDAGTNKHTKGKYTGQEINVTVDSIKCDGEEIEFDDSKIVKGNIETDNNCYRLEIYNEYGKGKADPGVDQSKLLFSKSLEVTFTITGLDKE